MEEIKNRNQLLGIPVVVFIVSTILLVLGIVNFWFGEVRDGIMLFCEHARNGLVKQPSNSFSNLGFSVAGLVVAWLMFKNKFDTFNRMTTTYFYPIFFSSVVILLGAGSFAMHATNTNWGGFFDLLSMFLFSSFVFSYALMRWFRFSRTVFLAVYFFNVASCSWLHLSDYNDIGTMLKADEICFMFHLIFAVVIEVALKYVRGNDIEIKWGLMGVLSLLVAFVIWNLSRTQDSMFCDPHSLIQGHAMWHLLDALGAYFVFVYYVSESEKPA